MEQRPPKYSRAKRAFRKIKDKHRLIIFYDLPAFPVSREEVAQCVHRCAHNGVVGLIPRLPADLTPSPDLLPQVREFYELLLDEAEHHGIGVGVHIEEVLEQAFYMSPAAEAVAHTRSRSIIRREYYCDPHEKLHLNLHEGTLMSIMAYDDEHTDMIDLREHVHDGILSYTVPGGNWTIEQYLCTQRPQVGDRPHFGCNLLSFDDAMDFLEALLSALGPRVKEAMGNTVRMLFISDMCFNAPNRRNWDEGFNEEFIRRFGFDPAPYYPALYHTIGERSPHLKALFMSCRAEMLRSGALAALRAFSDRYGVMPVTALAQPKLPACSWLNGDTLAAGIHAPCSVQEKAYLYGMNSNHLATSAADNYGCKHVPCELFRDYEKLTTDLVYKDAMNSFGHGANMLLVHWGNERITGTVRRHSIDRFRMDVLGLPGRYTFSAYVARVQTLLRGGTRVNDIAMIYPIYALHDKVTLYEAPTLNVPFEYPNTPFSCNYMTVLNTLSTYAGQDVTLLHPEVLNSACTVSGGELTLKNPFQTQRFRVLILPGADMMSLQNLRMVKDFYDGGGKVIATGALPRMAFEYTPEAENDHDPADFMAMMEYGTPADREVRAIIRHIFGEEAVKGNIIREFFRNANEAGGEAYYVSAHRTAADGTELTDCVTLNNLLQSFHVPLDVYMPDMPRFECIGAFNNSYTEFKRLGLAEFVPGGGMISHTHKRREDPEHGVTLDIYFFANTSDRSYEDTIYLRGIHTLECWDPHTGRVTAHGTRHVRYRGEIYTRTHLYLPEGRSLFFVSRPNGKRAAHILAIKDSLPDVTREINMMEKASR